MADSLSVSITGETELLAVLERAITEVTPEARAVVQKGALNVKTEWRKSWTGIKHARRIPYSITYETTFDPGFIGAEIGPEDNAANQGFLGHIFEYGGIHSPPIPGGLPALANEEPRFQAAIEILSLKLLP